MKDWYILGIDNGLTGYACLLHTSTGAYKFIPTPGKVGAIAIYEYDMTKTAAAAEYDVRSMHKIAKAAKQLSQGNCLAIVEEVIITSQGRNGSQTSRQTQESLVKGKSFWSAVCELEDIPVFCVLPSRWKAGLGLIGKKKGGSIELAERMGVTLPQSTRGDKSDDAAESFLIAKWFATNSVVAAWE